MVILSINGIFDDASHSYLERYHDTNATLIVDSQYIGSLEEERFTRKKYCNDFPINSINKLLNLKNLTYDDVDIVSYVLNVNIIKNNNEVSLKKFLEEKSILFFKNAKVLFFDHHFAHSIGSFLTSKFDQCNLLSMDGLGTYTAILDENNEIIKYQNNWGFFGVASKNPFQFHKLKNFDDHNVKFEDNVNSLGNFYHAFSCCAYQNKVNFNAKHLSDSICGKIMGLQGYGKKVDVDAPEIITVKKYLENEIPEIVFNYSIVDYNNYYKKYLINLSPEDLSFWTQKTLEDTIIKFFSLLPKNFKYDNLCFSGGVALNILLNSKLLSEGIFKEVHVHPATSDSGLSVGPALFLAKENGYDIKIPKNISLVGLKYEDKFTKYFILKDDKKYNIEDLLTSLNLTFTELTENEISNIISDKLVENKIIAWYQGNSEFGPRALGNRSILANPCFDNKQILNEKVKVREYWRPYACAVLQEYQNEWFEIPTQESFYMLFSSIVKQEKRQIIPSVTHIDNTCRIQSVTKEQNQRFYNLIYSFYKKTNIPLLLNTSFNTFQGEPIVETPLDAVKSFMNSKIDTLVINNYIITKEHNEAHSGKEQQIIVNGGTRR